jgi:hypothetical protein
VQTSPFFVTPDQISNEEFVLVSWITTVPTLGMITYTVRPFNRCLEDDVNLSVVTVTVKDMRSVEPTKPFKVESLPRVDPLALANDRLSAEF